MDRPGALPDVPHWKERAAFAAFDASGAQGPTLPWRMSFDGPATEKPLGGNLGPLEGLAVVDFSMGWAGPLCARTLADMGADVVKIESLGHPDWWRGWEPSADADPPIIEIQPHFNAMNRNKRGVSVDLQTPEGQAIARALVEGADVVIDNYAAGVLDKLSLGPDAQRAIQPNVVSVTMPAFGTIGPLAGLRARVPHVVDGPP